MEVLVQICASLALERLEGAAQKNIKHERKAETILGWKVVAETSNLAVKVDRDEGLVHQMGWCPYWALVWTVN